MLFPHKYRPQTKFAKVMFSQVSVCPRGGAYSIACWDTHPQPRDQRQTPPWADTPWAETPWVNTPLDRHPHRQRPPCSVHAGIRSTSGRYASHWNAFLFWNVLSLCRSTITLSQDNFWRANITSPRQGNFHPVHLNSKQTGSSQSFHKGMLLNGTKLGSRKSSCLQKNLLFFMIAILYAM